MHSQGPLQVWSTRLLAVRYSLRASAHATGAVPRTRSTPPIRLDGLHVPPTLATHLAPPPEHHRRRAHSRDRAHGRLVAAARAGRVRVGARQGRAREARGDDRYRHVGSDSCFGRFWGSVPLEELVLTRKRRRLAHRMIIGKLGKVRLLEERALDDRLQERLLRRFESDDALQRPQ